MRDLGLETSVEPTSEVPSLASPNPGCSAVRHNFAAIHSHACTTARRTSSVYESAKCTAPFPRLVTPSIEAPPQTSELADAQSDAADDRRRPSAPSRPSYPWWQRANPVHHLSRRIELSRAKHASLAGHPRIALALSHVMPHYEYAADDAFGLDGAPPDVVSLRRDAFGRLG